MRTVLVTLALLFWSITRVLSQDPLAAARDLYTSARYDEALSLLDGLPAVDRSPQDRLALEQVRTFCLLALGRAAEAEQAIAEIIATDPNYRGEEADISPRIRTAFRDVRQRLLPGLAQQEYAAAKTSYDRKEYEHAAEGFRLVVGLLEDPDMQGRLPDLRVLAAGFLELATVALTPPPPPTLTVPEPPLDPAVRIYDANDAVVEAAQALRQDLPKVPSAIARAAREFGLLEVVVNEQGHVESASVIRSVHPKYDALLLEAARAWRYRPAVLSGQPVKYRKVIQIKLK